MKTSGTHPRDRAFFARIVGIGLACFAIVLSVVFLQTAILDRQASKVSNDRVAAVLAEWTERVALATQNFDLRNVQLTSVSQGGSDTKAAFQFDTDRLDWIAVLDDKSNVIGEWNLSDASGLAGYLSGTTFARVLARADDAGPAQSATIAGAFEHDGQYFLAATVQKTATDLEEPAIGSQIYVVGGKNLDKDALSRVGMLYNLSGLTLSQGVGEDADGTIALDGPLGIAGHLSWQAELQGTLIRKIALPWVFLISTAFVLFTAWLARSFCCMAESLTEMHVVATTDHLTGVSNRAALNEFLQTPTVRDALQNGGLAVISIDLDDFKNVNDMHGHHAGDTALQLAAERISASLRKDDKIVRMGGDEFLCLVFDKDARSVANKVVDRLKESFKDPMDLGGFSQIVTPSIGVAISGPGEGWDVVQRRSDAAMYREKRSRSESDRGFGRRPASVA